MMAQSLKCWDIYGTVKRDFLSVTSSSILHSDSSELTKRSVKAASFDIRSVRLLCACYSAGKAVSPGNMVQNS